MQTAGTQRSIHYMTDIQPYMARFPWHSDVEPAIAEMNPGEAFDEEAVRERAAERVTAAVNSGTLAPGDSDGADDDFIELASYPAARVIVSLLDDRRITTTYARAEAAAAATRVIVEDDDEEGDSGIGGWGSTAKEDLTIEEALADFDVSVEWVPPADRFEETHAAQHLAETPGEPRARLYDHFARTDGASLGIDREPTAGTESPREAYAKLVAAAGERETLPALPIEDYTRLAAHMDSEEWGLSHREVAGGRVVLPNEGMLRSLLEEAVYQEVADRLPMEVPDEFASLFDEEVASVRENLSDEAFSYEINRVEEDAFPPVMNYLIDQIRQGNHLKHEARFAIASFLINIGMSDNEIIDIFEINHDFGEKETRYQLNHIRNGGGDGEPYTPPTYDTMQTWGLDWPTDSLEEQVNHPLAYYRIKLEEIDEEDDEEDTESSEGDGDENESESESDSDNGAGEADDDEASDDE